MAGAVHVYWPLNADESKPSHLLFFIEDRRYFKMDPAPGQLFLGSGYAMAREHERMLRRCPRTCERMALLTCRAAVSHLSSTSPSRRAEISMTRRKKDALVIWY